MGKEYTEVMFFNAVKKLDKDNHLYKDGYFINMDAVNEFKYNENGGTIKSIKNISLILYLKTDKDRSPLSMRGTECLLNNRPIKTTYFTFTEYVYGKLRKSKDKIGIMENNTTFTHEHCGGTDYQDMVSLFYPETPNVKIINEYQVAIPLMFGVEKEIKDMLCYTTIPWKDVAEADFLFTANVSI